MIWTGATIVCQQERKCWYYSIQLLDQNDLITYEGYRPTKKACLERIKELKAGGR